jgi:hypothetical protein
VQITSKGEINTYTILVDTPEWKTPYGGDRCKEENKIKTECTGRGNVN